MKNSNDDKNIKNSIITFSEKFKNEVNKENINIINYFQNQKEKAIKIKYNNNIEDGTKTNNAKNQKEYHEKVLTGIQSNTKENFIKNKNLKNPFIMEKIYSLSYFNKDKDFKNNKIKENNKEQNLEENKKIEDYEKIINYNTSVWSSLENEKNSIKNNSTKYKKRIKKKYNSFDQENIESNIINNLNEDKIINNIFSPVVSDIKNNGEMETEKYTICEVNNINRSKAPNIEQLITYNKTDNNVISQSNKTDTKTQILNNFEKTNKNNNDKSVKNKFYQYLRKMDLDSKNENNNFKLVLNNKKRQNIIKNEENSKELTYPGLKRYRNYSTRTVKNIEIIANNILSNPINKRRQNKFNALKKEIHKLSNFNYKEYNTNYKKMKRNNVPIDNLYKAIIRPNIINNHEQHFNSILDELNKTMRKFPKNNTNSNINLNKTSRTFPINAFDLNDINNFSKTKKIDNCKNLFFNFKKPEKINKLSEKNEKLIFESKVNKMNNTINKLLLKNSDFCNYNSTHPANSFKKNKSITNIRIRKVILNKNIY